MYEVDAARYFLLAISQITGIPYLHIRMADSVYRVNISWGRRAADMVSFTCLSAMGVWSNYN